MFSEGPHLLGLDVEEKEARQRRSVRRLDLACEYRLQLRRKTDHQRTERNGNETRHTAPTAACELADGVGYRLNKSRLGFVPGLWVPFLVDD